MSHADLKVPNCLMSIQELDAVSLFMETVAGAMPARR